MEDINFSNLKNKNVDLNKVEVEENQDENYSNLIDAIRDELIKRYNETITSLIENKTEENEKKIKGYLEVVLSDSYPTYKKDIEQIYNDIFGFAFIDDWLKDPSFEEMNGNSWNFIEVITTDGFKILDKGFNSPQHAKNVIKKMMSLGRAILDEASPTLDSFIGTGLRLTATIDPVVDEDVGVTFSLRKLKGRKIDLDSLVYKYDAYSQDEVDFVKTCLNYGVSVLFGGATSSGKSSDMQSFLTAILKKGDLRCYTIEENTRELDLIINSTVKNRQISRVIHTKTRYANKNNSSNTLNVDSDLLVKTALRYHPDIIVPAEMRGKEAKEAVDASQTGHTIVSSAHVKSVTSAYKRLLSLVQKSDNNSASEDMMMEAIIEAFPIVVFKRQLKEDDSRRCEKIFEAVAWDKKEKKIIGNILYRYIKAGVVTNSNGKMQVVGEHKKLNYASFKLCQQLYEAGLDVSYIKKHINPNFDIDENLDYIEDYIKYDNQEVTIV